MGTARSPRQRESYAERRERHAAVDDPAVVLEAAARFLEVRSRSVAEVRRRLGGAGYRTDENGMIPHAALGRVAFLNAPLFLEKKSLIGDADARIRRRGIKRRGRL